MPILEKDYKNILGKGQLVIVSTWDKQECGNYSQIVLSYSEDPTMTQYQVPGTRHVARHSGVVPDM